MGIALLEICLFLIFAATFVFSGLNYLNFLVQTTALQNGLSIGDNTDLRANVAKATRHANRMLLGAMLSVSAVVSLAFIIYG